MKNQRLPKARLAIFLAILLALLQGCGDNERIFEVTHDTEPTAFSVDDGKNWSETWDDETYRELNDLFEIQEVFPYLESLGALNDTAADKLISRLSEIRSELNNVSVRIPLKITARNTTNQLQRIKIATLTMHDQNGKLLEERRIEPAIDIAAQSPVTLDFGELVLRQVSDRDKLSEHFDTYYTNRPYRDAGEAVDVYRTIATMKYMARSGELREGMQSSLPKVEIRIDKLPSKELTSVRRK
ncbi:MAG: hypothetical protein ACFHX7_22045 [Pseudomonadota bacterium]